MYWGFAKTSQVRLLAAALVFGMLAFVLFLVVRP
jgi:hypothetical protein